MIGLHLMRLSWKHLAHHKLRSTLLALCIFLSILLPLLTARVADLADDVMTRRARETPLAIGRRGSALQLVLNLLYFRTRAPESLPYAEVKKIARKDPGVVVPLHTRITVQGHPLIATTMDYVSARGLRTRDGRPFQIMGEIVLGGQVARKLGAKVGDLLLSDTADLYNISALYPLELEVVGILERTRTADDNAVFTDLRTAWVIEGIGHGHKNARDALPEDLLPGAGSNTVFNASLVQHARITRENLSTFHFHGNDEAYPVTGILVFPKSDKARTILKGTTNLSTTIQAVSPEEVIEQLFALVLVVKRIVMTYFGFVVAATLTFLFLVIALTVQVRERERRVLETLGGSRFTIFYLMFMEVGLLVAAGTAAGWLGSHLVVAWLRGLQIV